MKQYIAIDCPLKVLKTFLNDFSHVTHIAIGHKSQSDIHYIGFDHQYPIQAVKEFAKKNGCAAFDIAREEVIKMFHSNGEMAISHFSNFDPLLHRL